jgi:hypothetical protein
MQKRDLMLTLVTVLAFATLAHGQTQLVVSPMSLALTSTSYGVSSYQCISLTSSDGRAPDSIPYAVSYNAVSPPGTWLQYEQVPVSSSPSAPVTICVHFVYPAPPAGTYNGNVTITSSIAPTVVVPVSVVVGGTPAISSVANAASFASAINWVSPGEVISIFGANLGPVTPVSFATRLHRQRLNFAWRRSSSLQSAICGEQRHIRSAANVR